MNTTLYNTASGRASHRRSKAYRAYKLEQAKRVLEASGVLVSGYKLVDGEIIEC